MEQLNKHGVDGLWTVDFDGDIALEVPTLSLVFLNKEDLLAMLARIHASEDKSYGPP